jgi:hypothetical protein
MLNICLWLVNEFRQTKSNIGKHEKQPDLGDVCFGLYII